MKPLIAAVLSCALVIQGCAVTTTIRTEANAEEETTTLESDGSYWVWVGAGAALILAVALGGSSQYQRDGRNPPEPGGGSSVCAGDACLIDDGG